MLPLGSPVLQRKGVTAKYSLHGCSSIWLHDSAGMVARMYMAQANGMQLPFMNTGIFQAAGHRIGNLQVDKPAVRN